MRAWHGSDRRRGRGGAILALAGVVAAVLVTTLTFAGRHGARGSLSTGGAAAPSAGSPPSVGRPRPASFAVGLRVLRFVDHSRTIRLPDGSSEPRTLIVYLRYPAAVTGGKGDLRDAPVASADGPFPLIVFGHGFAVTPSPYSRLLRSWVRAGYVVAAPLFPLGSARAPGGPNEADIVNQPADMRFLISQMIALSRSATGPLAGLVDPHHIAVAGQSDGGDTALAAADDPRFRDTRIGAVIVLSGAEIPGIGEFAFPRHSPPLLATQGTSDTINLPSETYAFFKAAPRPKYLLRLLGSEHLPPYDDEQPQLGIVERVTTAFLDTYLERQPAAAKRIVSLGDVPGTATMLAEP